MDDRSWRSPSLERLMERRPSFTRPPVRSVHSPKLTEGEAVMLTSPFLRYRTRYTYASSQCYDSNAPDGWEVPNLANNHLEFESPSELHLVHSSLAAPSVFRQVWNWIVWIFMVIVYLLHRSFSLICIDGPTAVVVLLYDILSASYLSVYSLFRSTGSKVQFVGKTSEHQLHKRIINHISHAVTFIRSKTVLFVYLLVEIIAYPGRILYTGVLKRLFAMFSTRSSQELRHRDKRVSYSSNERVKLFSALSTPASISDDSDDNSFQPTDHTSRRHDRGYNLRNRLITTESTDTEDEGFSERRPHTMLSSRRNGLKGRRSDNSFPQIYSILSLIIYLFRSVMRIVMIMITNVVNLIVLPFKGIKSGAQMLVEGVSYYFSRSNMAGSNSPHYRTRSRSKASDSLRAASSDEPQLSPPVVTRCFQVLLYPFRFLYDIVTDSVSAVTRIALAVVYHSYEFCQLLGTSIFDLLTAVGIFVMKPFVNLFDRDATGKTSTYEEVTIQEDGQETTVKSTSVGYEFSQPVLNVARWLWYKLCDGIILIAAIIYFVFSTIYNGLKYLKDVFVGGITQSGPYLMNTIIRGTSQLRRRKWWLLPLLLLLLLFWSGRNYKDEVKSGVDNVKEKLAGWTSASETVDSDEVHAKGLNSIYDEYWARGQFSVYGLFDRVVGGLSNCFYACWIGIKSLVQLIIGLLSGAWEVVITNLANVWLWICDRTMYCVNSLPSKQWLFSVIPSVPTPYQLWTSPLVTQARSFVPSVMSVKNTGNWFASIFTLPSFNWTSNQEKKVHIAEEVSGHAAPQVQPPVVIMKAADPVDEEKLVREITEKVQADMELKLKSFQDSYMAILEEMNKKQLSADIDYAKLEVLIRQAIYQYDADKSGMFDYALESAGASIVSIRCSENYNSFSRLEKIWNIPLWYSSYGPRTVIQRNSLSLFPGECWSFKGGVGYLTIDLSHAINISSISYEHIGENQAPDGFRSSAPKTFKFWAYQSVNDFDTRFLLGSYEYKLDGHPLQVFIVKDHPDYPVKLVEMEITSNYGADFTCLYRLRVHGTNYKTP